MHPYPDFMTEKQILNTTTSILKHTDLIFDFGKARLYQTLFSKYLAVAFEALSQANPKVRILLDNGNSDELIAIIEELVRQVAAHDYNPFGHGVGWHRTTVPEESEFFKGIDNVFSRWDALHIGSTSNLRQSISRFELDERMYFIGEIFLNIDRVWTLLHQSDDERNPNLFAREIFNRIGILDDAYDRLVTLCVAAAKGKRGGASKGIKRTRCRGIIQDPTYGFKTVDKRVNPVKDNIRRLKAVYESIYRESLQTQNSKGKLSPTDRTLENWLYEFAGTPPTPR